MRNATKTGCAALLAMTVLGGTAGANESMCGYGWNWYNAPTGAAVLSRSDDIVSTIMNAVGEWYTHSTISAGDGYNVFHSTMGDPAMCFYAFGGMQVCTGDIKDPSPGPSQISVAAYNYFLNSTPLQAVDAYYHYGNSGQEQNL